MATMQKKNNNKDIYSEHDSDDALLFFSAII